MRPFHFVPSVCKYVTSISPAPPSTLPHERHRLSGVALDDGGNDAGHFPATKPCVDLQWLSGLDVDRDAFISPLDVLAVINPLNRGELEASPFRTLSIGNTGDLDGLRIRMRSDERTV